MSVNRAIEKMKFIGVAARFAKTAKLELREATVAVVIYSTLPPFAIAVAVGSFFIIQFQVLSSAAFVAARPTDTHMQRIDYLILCIKAPAIFIVCVCSFTFTWLQVQVEIEAIGKAHESQLRIDFALNEFICSLNLLFEAVCFFPRCLYIYLYTLPYWNLKYRKVAKIKNVLIFCGAPLHTEKSSFFFASAEWKERKKNMCAFCRCFNVWFWYEKHEV